MNALIKAVAVSVVGAWAFTPPTALAQNHGDHGQHGHGTTKHQEKGHDDSAKLPLCPVMGNPIDFNVKTMADEGPVYFCCPMCIKKLERDPAKYAEKVAVQREALKKMKRIQVNCPITGNPIDGKTFAMIEGKGVYFCCQRCVAQYEKDPAKYAGKLEGSYTYQTLCPVGDEKIDPTSYVDLSTGERIYLCCGGCANKLQKDPERYAPKLAEQGINIDVKKLKGEQGKHDDGHDHERP